MLIMKLNTPLYSTTLHRRSVGASDATILDPWRKKVWCSEPHTFIYLLVLRKTQLISVLGIILVEHVLHTGRETDSELEMYILR